MQTDERYPIGKYEPKPYSEAQKTEWLNAIYALPEELERVVQTLDDAQLNTPYREGGWTVKQLIHHIADSHMNAYIRFKLGLTEDKPIIKPYEEKAWALLADNETVPVNISLTLLHALHRRWYAAIEHLTQSDFERVVIHPQQGREMSLWLLLGLYAWHGKHHTAHITTLKERMRWQ
ncbi:MAG: bacillithiol transferase BstA [Bacteroidota bacterium]|jgi:uncharacterized damage-inducible protein DinB|nr:bacillithiol transferase BstA [Bacteroidota bacterium]